MTLKCLTLQGAPYIYDISRLRVNAFVGFLFTIRNLQYLSGFKVLFSDGIEELHIDVSNHSVVLVRGSDFSKERAASVCIYPDDREGIHVFLINDCDC
jgi:hypothetical protein